LNNFVAERLFPCEEREVIFRDPVQKNKALTFSSLFEVGHTQSALGKEIAINADRKVLQTLISAYEAGRDVNLSEVMTHELLPMPQALAEMNGSLQTGSEAILSLCYS